MYLDSALSKKKKKRAILISFGSHRFQEISIVDNGDFYQTP
jgi:hypothetical protein